MKARALWLFAFLPGAASADVDMTFNDGSIILVKGGRVLFGETDNSVLYEPGREGLIVLNRQQQSYMELKPGYAEELARQLEAQMEEALESVPPEHREQLEAELGVGDADASGDGAVFSVERTGKHDEVAGFECHEVEIVTGAGDTREIVCVASAAELGISDEDYASLAGFMRKLAEIAAVSADGDSPIDLDVLGGIPIRSEDIDYGEQSELTSISTAELDAARIAIPDDYSEVSVQALLGQ